MDGTSLHRTNARFARRQGRGMEREVIRCRGARIARSDLAANAARVAGGLDAMGVSPGDRVAVLLRNALEFLEICTAVGRLGAYSVLINWHFRLGEIEALLDDAAPSVIFAHGDLADLIPEPFRASTPVILLDPSDGAGPAGLSDARDYRQWRDSAVPFDGAARIAPGSIIYTSGTTGRPKGVERVAATSDQQRAMETVRSQVYGIGAETRALVPGPLYHAFPYQFAMLAAQRADYLEVMAGFDAEQLLATIARERITSVALAPIMMIRLLALPDDVRRRYDLSSLRWALHAGGPCPAETKRAMIAWWGPIVGEFYGGTETGPLTLCGSQEWLDHPGTCGRPLADVTLRIVNDAGDDVATGESGEIFGRLHCYPDFVYRNDPAKRASVARGDLVSLGDIGYRDADGYLYLCDRSRDMIISGGVNIYPAEIESALYGLSGVQDCAVVGTPDPEFGEAVVAFVAGEGVDGNDLRGALRALIAGYKVPREIIVVPSLERDDSGKIRKAHWRDRYLSLRAADAAERSAAL